MAGFAQRYTADLSDTMPYDAAAVWVHTSAVVAHAVSLDLIPDTIDVIAGLHALAAHPSLTAFIDPSVNRALTYPLAAKRQAELLTSWNGHPLVEQPAQLLGYALGDMYQELSVEARKGRALCQTPSYVTKLLLDMTVPPVIDQWGLDGLRMIDPACGTGHILIETLLQVWIRLHGPDNRRPFQGCRIERAMSAVHGVDLDPYAVVVARYRLLAAACRFNAGTHRLAEAPTDWIPKVAATNSLLNRAEPLLQRSQYNLVLGNPPYITVKDPATNEEIRAAYPEVCSGKYSLALPFTQLMTDLAAPGGWIAQLTTNSWMKREFGKKFIEQYLPRYDLRWVIDTSGAYIPGHGTPTVILVHRNQAPVSDMVSSVLGIRGEPSTPPAGSAGVVWDAIADAVRTRLSYQRFRDGSLAGQPAPEPAVDEAAKPEPVTPLRHTQPSLFDLLEAA